MALCWAAPGPYVSEGIAPHGGSPFGFEKRTCSFLGGAVIDVEQETPGEPALFTVTAEWNVAWLKPSPDVDYRIPDNRHSLGQWVGILGIACDRDDWYPFLQAGTAMDGNGTSSASAWVEWFPAASQGVSKGNMAVSPSDQMRVSVQVSSRTTGHVYMENLSTGQKWDSPVNAPTPDDPRFQICLGHGNAQIFTEWGIKNDRDNPIVFNNVTFSNVAAVSRSQKNYDFGSGTQDYWDMSSDTTHFALPEAVDNTTFRLYTPEGKYWDPLIPGCERGC
ncbi:peptidase A4 family-domain-containing protein [Biscogniauxia marginata]|nr:peptidase A4 family-domain-containing protein [Biscogniauxia marginata]